MIDHPFNSLFCFEEIKRMEQWKPIKFDAKNHNFEEDLIAFWESQNLQMEENLAHKLVFFILETKGFDCEQGSAYLRELISFLGYQK